MIDKDFIAERIERGKQALDKARTAFGPLTLEQFNWKPSDERWSIAECLQHLLISDQCYFKDLTEIANGTYRMTLWERRSPLTSLLGKALKEQMKEKVVRKMVTHKRLSPTASAYDLNVLVAYCDNLSRFMELVWQCREADLDKTIIGSPTLGWVTYSLRNALEFLFEHEHRHINQAISVMKEPGFPDGRHSGVL